MCVSLKVRSVRWCLCLPASQLRSTARSTPSSRSRRCSGSLQTDIACPSPVERAGVYHCSLYRWFFDDHLTNDNDKRTTCSTRLYHEPPNSGRLFRRFADHFKLYNIVLLRLATKMMMMMTIVLACLFSTLCVCVFCICPFWWPARWVLCPFWQPATHVNFCTV